MICLKTVKQFCQDYWLIENYQEAVNDQTQVWDCHHRRETNENLSRIDLMVRGQYFNITADELIFIPHSEHAKLHAKGRIIDEESRHKISESVKKRGGHSGENNPNYKYHITEEELYDLYIVQNLTLKQIAELHGSHLSCIHHKLKKYNIIKNG